MDAGVTVVRIEGTASVHSCSVLTLLLPSSVLGLDSGDTSTCFLTAQVDGALPAVLLPLPSAGFFSPPSTGFEADADGFAVAEV